MSRRPFRSLSTSRSGSAPRLLLTVVMGAGLVAAAPGAAHADTDIDNDEGKDVVKLDPETGEFKAAPRFRQNDVKSTKLIHTSDKVEVRLKFAQLKKADHLSWFMAVVPAKGDAREATLQAAEGAWSGTLSVRDFETKETVECGKHDIDYKDDVVRITLPRDCVGGGKWVKFHVGAITDTDNATYGDDALRDRPLKESDRFWALSGRVYR